MEQLAPRRNLRDELKDRGVRMTHQREIVLELIQGSARHLDAESLWKLAVRKDPHINLATIYRTLTLLKRFGLVDELDLMHIEGEKHYYEVARLRSHIHLASKSPACAAIFIWPASSVEKFRSSRPRFFPS